MKIRHSWLAILAVAVMPGAALAAERRAVPPPTAWPLKPLTGYDPPQMILFAAMDPAYLRDHAARVRAWGFQGFLFHIGNWEEDIWAKDGDPSTRGADDPYFQTLRDGIAAGRAAGIDANFMIFAFYKPLPDWFDDAAWAQVSRQWAEVARFAREAGCRGVAQDWEYIGKQYHFDYPDYDFTKYSREQLRAKVRQRFHETTSAMLAEFPAMELAQLPEVAVSEGDLTRDMYQGMLEALAEREAPGGFHLFAEYSYLMRDPVWLITYARRLGAVMDGVLAGPARAYWQQRGTIALGAWPLGREKGDPRGANYSPQEFARQVAALRMACPRYAWIYPHGPTWWQYSAPDLARYGQSAAAQPTVPDIAAYRDALAAPKVIANPELERLAAGVRQQPQGDLRAGLGAISDWWLIGPFDNRDGVGFTTAYGPQRNKRRIDPGATYGGLSGPVRWQVHREPDPLGIVDLGAVFGPDQQTAAYAFCYLQVDRPVRGQLRACSNDDMVIWLDGKKIWVRDRPRGVRNIDDDVIPVALAAGRHALLVKVCNRGRAWEFGVRFTDRWGLPLRGVRAAAPPASPPPPTPAAPARQP